VQAMRDLRESLLFQRAELSAVASLLILKGVITQEEWETVLEIEADALERMLQEKFPGYRATAQGIEITPTVAMETNRVLGFPE